MALVLSVDESSYRFVETNDGGYIIRLRDETILGFVIRQSDGNFNVVTPDGRTIGRVNQKFESLTPQTTQSPPTTQAIPLNTSPPRYEPPTLKPNVPISPPSKTGMEYGRGTTTTTPRTPYYNDLYRSSPPVNPNGRTTYSNRNGQNLGSSSSDRKGNTTYFGPNGQNLGRSNTNRGNTYYYNRNGQRLGSK